MALYHLSASLIRRSTGRSATAAAAYRSAEVIRDARTDEIHDYRRKAGVIGTRLLMPAGVDWSPSREELWSGVEVFNTRRNAQVAREFTVALPAELDDEGREALAVAFAQEVADAYRIAADVAIHRPSRSGDERNHHAHILTSTSGIEADGSFGKKVRALDGIASKKADKTAATAIDALRERWSEMTNAALAASGSDERVDHRSYAARAEAGEEAAALMTPEPHVGPRGTGMDRRGVQSDRADERRTAQAHNDTVREIVGIERAIVDSEDQAIVAAATARREAEEEAERQAIESAVIEVRTKREAAATLQWWHRLAETPTPLNSEFEPKPSLDLESAYGPESEARCVAQARSDAVQAHEAALIAARRDLTRDPVLGASPRGVAAGRLRQAACDLEALAEGLMPTERRPEIPSHDALCAEVRDLVSVRPSGESSTTTRGEVVQECRQAEVLARQWRTSASVKREAADAADTQRRWWLPSTWRYVRQAEALASESEAEAARFEADLKRQEERLADIDTILASGRAQAHIERQTAERLAYAERSAAEWDRRTAEAEAGAMPLRDAAADLRERADLIECHEVDPGAALTVDADVWGRLRDAERERCAVQQEPTTMRGSQSRGPDFGA